jgi:hypothetical protein
MDMENVRKRLQRLAEDVVYDGETATVTLATSSDVPGWQAEVTWTSARGEREWAGFKGRLEDLEPHMIIKISTRKERTDRLRNGPPPPPLPKPGDVIKDERESDPFKWLRG